MDGPRALRFGRLLAVIRWRPDTDWSDYYISAAAGVSGRRPAETGNMRLPCRTKQKAAGLTHFITQHISYFYAQATSAFVFIYKSLRIQECQRLLARNIRKGFLFLFIPPLPAALPLVQHSLLFSRQQYQCF